MTTDSWTRLAKFELFPEKEEVGTGPDWLLNVLIVTMLGAIITAVSAVVLSVSHAARSSVVVCLFCALAFHTTSIICTWMTKRPNRAKNMILYGVVYGLMYYFLSLP